MGPLPSLGILDLVGFKISMIAGCGGKRHRWVSVRPAWSAQCVLALKREKLSNCFPDPSDDTPTPRGSLRKVRNSGF